MNLLEEKNIEVIWKISSSSGSMSHVAWGIIFISFPFAINYPPNEGGSKSSCVD